MKITTVPITFRSPAKHFHAPPIFLILGHPTVLFFSSDLFSFKLFSHFFSCFLRFHSFSPCFQHGLPFTGNFQRFRSFNVPSHRFVGFRGFHDVGHFFVVVPLVGLLLVVSFVFDFGDAFRFQRAAALFGRVASVLAGPLGGGGGGVIFLVQGRGAVDVFEVETGP